MQPNTENHYQKRADDVVLFDILRIIRTHWISLITISFLLTAGAFSASYLLTPKYRGTVLMSYVSSGNVDTVSGLLGGQLGRLSSLAGINADGRSGEVEAVALLTAREFTNEFIRQNNLMPILFADKWDTEQGEWKSSDPEYVPTPQDAFKKFDENIRSVSVDRESGLISLSIFWKDPQQSAKWANALATEANARLRDKAINEANKSIEFLEKELERTTINDVRLSIYELVASNIQTAMLVNVREDYAFRVLDPALPSDANRYESPNHLLFVLLGITFSLIYVFIFVWWKSLQSSPAIRDSKQDG